MRAVASSGRGRERRGGGPAERLLAQGLPLGSVARRMRTSERTVRRRTRAICNRLGVRASIQAVVWAAHQGLL